MAAVFDAHERGVPVALRTSGTSAGARAVVRTTASWFDSFPIVTRLLGLGPDSRVWVPGPITSTMNLFAAVHARVVGASVATSPAGATHAVLTPAALARTLAQAVPLESVHVLAAGDRLPRTLRDQALFRGAAAVSHYYGAAELSFVAWGSCAEDLTAFPGVELDCADGLIWVRSPYTCLGYVGPDGPLTRRADGYLTAGDRGRIEGGLLRVLGRGSDAVVTAGATVLPGDVETALEAATGHRVVVVGLPHPDLGQVLCGVVASREALADVRLASRSLPDPAQRPRRWVVLAEPPTTRAGKVDRGRLAEQVGGGDRSVDAS